MTNAQYNRFREQAEARFRGPIYVALQKQVTPVISAYKSGGYQAAIRAANDDLVNDALVPVMRDLYIAGGLYMARTQYKELKQLEVKGLIGDWTKLIKGFFDKYLIPKVVMPITHTTKEDLVRILNDSVKKALSKSETIKALRMVDRLKNRATMISRTEMGSAFGYGQVIAANEYPYETVKKWVAINDSRTRYTHRHGTGVDGQIRRMPERFGNGLLFPGDKAGRASEVINCRCRLKILPALVNGKFVFKPEGGVGVSAGSAALATFAQSLLLSEAIDQLINQEDETLRN